MVIARKQAVCTWEFVWDSAGGGPLEREDEHAPSVATGFFCSISSYLSVASHPILTAEGDIFIPMISGMR